jgi:hypothetical protein
MAKYCAACGQWQRSILFNVHGHDLPCPAYDYHIDASSVVHYVDLDLRYGSPYLPAVV